MKLETLEFSISRASLNFRETLAVDEYRDLALCLQLTSDAEVLHKNGEGFRGIPWYLLITTIGEPKSLAPLTLSHGHGRTQFRAPDQGTIGCMKYNSHGHHWCAGHICLSPMRFQSLLDSFFHDKVPSQITIGIRGLKGTDQGLMWPDVHGVELPIEEVAFSVQLFHQ